MRRIFFYTLICLSLSGGAFAAPPERIISLAPNLTEILYAMGLEERIVGVTSYCDQPPRAKDKPKIGGMSNPSLEAVVSLRPDMVVMTTDGNPREFEVKMRNLHQRTYVFQARQISELPQGIRDLGAALGAEEQALALALRIQDALDRMRAGGSAQSPKRKALFIVWPEPMIVAGPWTAMDDALHLLGLENIAHDVKTKYPKYSVEEIIHRNPDVIFIGKGHGNMQEVSKGLLQKLRMLDAVKKGRVYFTGDALYRLGPRVIDGIEELSGYLNRE
ncbi:MAG: ABC transporter substrate-binding protein [Deltaproteobacteria bacterium]|nr:ABC transporter substrate-binding protein [Deltaproteobacteria bacterium]